jgi:acetylornithine deacetylase/succinyl-diaminopimelate desuccinylase-like protein
VRTSGQTVRRCSSTGITTFGPSSRRAWTSPPFEPTIRDGRIYCRGSADNKGQLFAQLMAHRAWRAVAGSAPVNMTFLFDGEGESGSKHLPGFVRDHRGVLAADAVYFPTGRSTTAACTASHWGARAAYPRTDRAWRRT